MYMFSVKQTLGTAISVCLQETGQPGSHGAGFMPAIRDTEGLTAMRIKVHYVE